jgi:hypothetical protein
MTAPFGSRTKTVADPFFVGDGVDAVAGGTALVELLREDVRLDPSDRHRAQPLSDGRSGRPGPRRSLD